MVEPAVLLAGHGSRDARANAEMDAIVAAYRARWATRRIAVAYIELAEPLLADGLDAIASESAHVVVAPLFLFGAGHVKNDIPLALGEARRKFPRTRFSVAPCLGVHPLLVAMAHDRVATLLPEDAAARRKTLLVVVGRGSSDPDANGDFYKVARLVGERRGLFGVEPACIGIAEPSVATVLERAARLGPERIVVLPYFLFAGRLIEKLNGLVASFAAAHPWIRTNVAPHLGYDERLLALVDERVEAAVRGRATLECDACQYRTALPGLKNQVGGLRALLYSVRHTLTHAQATLPLHTHRPLKKHVLVCGNADCVDRGSIGVLDAIRRDVKRAGSARDIRVTRTSCMGRCGEGPTVAVYPDGVWYRGVAATDSSDIVHQHLLGDRLVERLVGDILH